MANAQQVKTESGDEVNLKKVDADVMAASCKALGIKVGKSATIAEMVGALSGFFAAKEAKGEDSGNCSNCGITYTFDLDVCPACGTAADDGEEESEKEEVEADSDDSDDAEKKPEPAKVAPVIEKPAEEAPKRKKKAKADVVLDDVEPKAAIAVSSKDLDKQVAEVRAVMAQEAGAWAVTHWKIGQKLKVIYDGSTWKQRTKEDGKTPAYKSWDAFVKAEIPMHVATTYDVMRVAAAFDEATVRRIGERKCILISRAPEIEHLALVEKAEQGATKEEIRAEVKAAREKYGKPKPKLKGAKRTEKASDASAKKRGRPVEKITVAQIVDEPHKVPLFTESSLKKGEDGSRKPVRARKFGEKPTGSLVLVNGVELHIRVAMTDKGAVAVVNFKRTAE